MSAGRVPPDTSASVVIIGAGLAGLSCAHAIRTEVPDQKLLVLEARHRIGGRVFTVDRSGKPLEMGAQWIHGGTELNNVFNFAKK